MKNLKKIFALVLAVMMIAAMSVSAFATGITHSTQNAGDVDVTGHSMTAYQILTATSYYSTSKKFGNLAWATGAQAAFGANGTETVDAFLTRIGGTDSETAEDFARDAATKTLTGLTSASVINGTTVLGMGLWLIVDNETGDTIPAVNLPLLYVSDGTAAFTVISKVDAPSSDKKVKDTNDSTGETTGWQDSADYDIGDDVPFKLTATLPSNYTDYATYHLTFHDKMCDGLSFNSDSVKVYVGDSTTAVASGNYTVTTSPSDGDTFDIAFTYANLIAMGVTNSNVIRVEYTATLTGNSVVFGQAGNPNTSWITYDNNPNSDQDGEEGGKTPEDTVIVFTYKTVVNKVDQNNEALTGANFTLYKEVPAPATGATKGSALTFSAGVEHSAINADKYYVVVGNKTGDATGSEFTFAGIDDGNYVLVETTVPAGYNAWNSAAVNVTATHTETADITPGTGKVAGSETFVLTALNNSNTEFTTVIADGTSTATIQNNQGSTLPSTGGIGTTIFYVLGSVLVLGAGIVLVTRKRMGEN